MDVSTLERWTVEQSVELYAIRNWGSGYFDVSPAGDVVVRLPRGGNHGEVSEVRLMDIVEGLKARGMMLPVVLRFADILGDRIRQINESFARAAQGIGYRGGYRGVYPIKVNQQQQVVEEVARQGRRWHHGLEAGSKAELIAALAYLQDPEAYLVCNGYKDEEFIRLALNAQKMGLRPILVLEMPGELELIRRVSESMNVRPAMGVRVKLASRAGGRWTESGGDRSVFGLNTAQVMDVVEELRKHGMLDCLQMLHYHLGSQIPNIDHIRQAIAEAARLYVELVREGAAMGILDIGGGLAVDYDGSHTNFPSSSNYDLFEYCSDVLEGIMRVADSAGVPHPTVISESGRALVAYHSVLLFQVLDTARLSSHPPPTAIPADAPEALRNLKELADQPLTAKNLQECYHDAVFYRDELRNGFLHGVVRLRDRAIGEQIFWHLADRVVREARSLKYVPEEIQKLEVALADIYYANFSVFQSLPDSWAIGQLFPIMPIHRLDERPSRLATFSDITCDCDGKIDRFIDLHDVKEALPVHPFRPNEDYIFGVFLVGAYQETLGDLHNLFGDTNVVTVAASPEGNGFELVHEIHGDSVADVLSYVEYDPKEMIERVRELAENAVRTGRITAEERRIILDDYGAGLRGYTYYET
jgi:arginine decarboxylase